MKKSTREVPWRLEVEVNGLTRFYVLQLDPKNMEREFRVLEVMETTSVPTPRVYGLDLRGEALGRACFFSDFIEGETLLDSMLKGEKWAEALYLDAVSGLQAVTEDELGDLAHDLKRETAADMLEDAHAFLKGASLPNAERAYEALKTTMPALPPVRFSNGDLWLENFIVKDRKLAGVIDFPGAAFSDPIFEFLLSFFVTPALQGRGVEDRYCRRMGYDPALLHWYHGLEYFDTLRWVLKTGNDFEHHTAENLEENLARWLEA
ncbi:MAG: phosphotransferase [Gemmatimonadetes bacterium]|nr:phosphotransferase [Gemmatimonadota bacterium]